MVNWSLHDDNFILPRDDTKDIDKRIANGDSVESVKSHKGYKLIFDEIETLRLQAMQQSLLLSNRGDAGLIWRAKLSAFDKIINIPERFIRDRDISKKELEEDRLLTSKEREAFIE